MYLFTVMSIVSAGILCNTIAVSPVFEEHHYLEKTGTTPTRIEWRLERGASHKLTVTRPNETYVCLCNDSFDTYQWEVKKPSAHTEIVAKREGNAIVIGGTFEGEAIKKELQIDDAPWYQAMTLSLKSLITSNKSSAEFWTIRFDNLSAYKMKAKKKGFERIKVCGGALEVEKVNVSLAGLKALLWDCCYWFRKEDGLFVRYEGRNGPPGHPKTVIELVEER